MTLRSVSESFRQTFEETVKRFRRHAEQVEMQAGLADKTEAHQSRTLISNWAVESAAAREGSVYYPVVGQYPQPPLHPLQGVALWTRWPYLKSFLCHLISHIATGHRTPRANISDDIRRRLLDYLVTFDFSLRQRKLSQARFFETGKWLLESEEFLRWRDGAETSRLWCSGIRTLLLGPVSDTWLTCLKLAVASPC